MFYTQETVSNKEVMKTANFFYDTIADVKITKDSPTIVKLVLNDQIWQQYPYQRQIFNFFYFETCDTKGFNNL